MKENFDNEEWRDVEGYDGAYQVSDLGRVRSKKYGRWRLLSASKDKDGYLTVLLSNNGKRKTSKVHRLVAQAFIENDDSGKNEINHINEDKTDNRADNLEWCDRKYNNTYNDIHHRRITKLCKIKSLYRPNLSIKKNIELFKSNGIECSRETVLRLRKELGLSRKYTKRS